VKAKGRRNDHTFSAAPHSIFRARGQTPPPAAALGKMARCFLMDLMQQLNGRNNGDLTAAPKVMESYGWTSRGTLDAVLVECVALGFLEQTRQGGRNRCSLYAVTWKGIDEGPHDAKPDLVPSNLWKPENAHRRDQSFVVRWEKQQTRRRQIVSLPATRTSVPATRTSQSRHE
jgi:hypothetical protein